jgi:hypothetical protein
MSNHSDVQRISKKPQAILAENALQAPETLLWWSPRGMRYWGDGFWTPKGWMEGSFPEEVKRER